MQTTPDNTTPGNSIDFAPTSVEDAANVLSPAEHAAHMKNLDNQFSAVQEEQRGPTPEDSLKMQALVADLQKPRVKADSVATSTPAFDKRAYFEPSYSMISNARISAKILFGRPLTENETRQYTTTTSYAFQNMMEDGKFEAAYKLNDKFMEKTGIHIIDCDASMRDAMRDAVFSGKASTFSKLLSLNKRYGVAMTPTFTRNDLGLMKDETVSPDITKIAAASFSEEIKEFTAFSGRKNSNMGLLDWYNENASAWASSGVIDREAINTLAGVKKAIKEDVEGYAYTLSNKKSNVGDPSQHLATYIERVAKTGVFSEEEMYAWDLLK